MICSETMHSRSSGLILRPVCEDEVDFCSHTHTHTHVHTNWACLRVDEGHHDVSSPSGGGQTLVVVRQAAGVHEGPALPGRLHVTVVPQEPAASALTHTVTSEHDSVKVLTSGWFKYTHESLVIRPECWKHSCSCCVQPR